MYLLIFLSIYVSMYLSTYLPTYLPIYLSIYIYMYMYMYIYIYIYIYVCVCVCVCVYAYIYIHTYICSMLPPWPTTGPSLQAGVQVPAIYQYIHLSICPPIHQMIYTSIHLYIYLSIYLSICIYIYICIYLYTSLVGGRARPACWRAGASVASAPHTQSRALPPYRRSTLADRLRRSAAGASRENSRVPRPTGRVY